MTDVETAWPSPGDATRTQPAVASTVRKPVDERVAPSILTPAPSTSPGAGISRGDVGAALNRGFITFAVAIVAFAFFLYTPSALQHGRSQEGLTRRFRNELTSQRAPVSGLIPNGAPVALIEIPAIGVHEIVVQGTTSGVTRAGPGHLAASVLPGQPGNSVIIGRRTAYGGPFKRLGSLHAGDEIRVTTGQGTARYAVVSERTEPAGNAQPMLPTTTARLTLVTSDPALFAKRYRVASARLETTPFESTGHASTILRAELGLTGDPAAAATLFVWLLVAAFVGMGAVVAWRRAPRAAAWLIVVPLVLATGWLVFENLVVLLPASL